MGKDLGVMIYQDNGISISDQIIHNSRQSNNVYWV